MREGDKARESLIGELGELRQRVAALEASETKRRQMWEGLKAEKGKMDSIINSIPSGIDIVGYDYRVQYQNRFSLDRFGDIRGKLCYEEYMNRDKPCSDCSMRRAIENNSAERTESTGADERIYEVLSTPIQNPDGTMSAVEVVMDISERKRAEEALRKCQERFRDLADLLPEAVYEIDLDGNVTFANQRAFRLSGYSQEDLERGLNVLQMFIPEDRGRARENMSRILAGEDLGFMEYTAQGKDGSRFPIVIHSAAIIHEGRVVGLRGIVIDISGLKETERKMRTLSSAVEQSINGIAIGDLEATLVYVNEAFARMHGYSAEEMIEMKALNLHSEEQMGAYNRDMNQIKNQGSWTGEIDHIRKDGTSFPTYMSITLLRDEKGKPTGMLAVCRDITERKEAEGALREREAELVRKTNSLEQVNTALGVLLKKRDEDKTELEEKVVTNVKELVVPFLTKLKRSPLDPQQLVYLDILESHLNAIISPFLRTLSAQYVSLTPTEIQVANLIKEGKNTKEIGAMMVVSPRTIESHRKNIRKKLGIGKKKGNLRSHLLAFQ